MREIDSMPLQRISYKSKNLQWKKDCVDYIIGHRNYKLKTNSLSTKEEMQLCYDLYDGKYNEKDLRYVTNPFNQEDGFPALALNMNIIKSKIDLLLGEETKKPFNYNVVRTSDQATSDAQDKAKELITQYVLEFVKSKLSEEDLIEFQRKIESGEIMDIPQIAKYMSQDYKDIAENVAYRSLKFLSKKLKLTHEFYKGLSDALKVGKEIYYVGIQNGQPYVEKVDPRYFAYKGSRDLEFIHDAEWCCYEMDMSLPELHDRLYDKLSEKLLNKIIDKLGTDGRKTNPEFGKDGYDYNHIKVNLLGGDDFSSNNCVKVFHVCWSSEKLIKFVTIIDPETGMPEEFQVDEQYVENGTELSVEKKWIREIWEGYKIESGDEDDDNYVAIQPIKYQYISVDNPNSQRLPYTGASYGKSMVLIMKPLQYMYITVWYRLELAMARDKGKPMLMDITQVPKSMGIDPAKWMHYLTALGVAFINPYEEGWDIPGRTGGNPATFNQMSSIDLTMANVINQYVMLMDKIESMASEISGITPLRQGAISSSELVGNVERSVIQSSNITEPWIWQHNQIKREVLTMLLNVSKFAWKDNKECLNYVFDDTTRAFLKLQDNFFYEDFDIFIDDSTKSHQQLEAIRNLMQPALQNGASLLDIAEIITLDNISMIKNKLSEIEDKRIKQQQEMLKQQSEQEMQLLQIQQQAKQQEFADKEADRLVQIYKIDLDNITKLAVAQMNTYIGLETLDANANGIPDPMEINKQALEAQKVKNDIYNKEKDRVILANLEKAKIDLEKQKILAQKDLQKLKDDAALEREKLKAKTAIKNKVSGEN